MADNNENKVLNVPHLRFPEFTDEWGKYKLSDVCSFFSGGTPSSSKKEYYDGSIPFIRSGELHMNKTELFITEEGLMYLANLHTSFLCNLIYPTFSRILLYSC